jgi:adenylate cyclase
VPVQPVERKLAAIFAADIAGYSRLMASDEVGTLARLKACRAIIDELIASHRGRIFNTAGDSVVADFASAVDAVQCAVAVQAAITTENARGADDEPMQFRIGVHVGDVMVDGENLLGDGVNIAARMESLAEPGAICVSAAARDHIGNKLPLGFDDLDEQSVKNIPQAIRVYRVQVEKPASHPVAALPLPHKPSLAVLAFDNMSGDADQEYFSDGMAEDIITQLSYSTILFVIARNSSFSYKGRAVDVKQIGRELGIRYVLQGSVRRAGERVRISAQLVEAETGNHIWAERYDRSLADVFAVQDEIANAVAKAIEPAIARTEQALIARKPPESLRAWEAYQRGLWHRTKQSAADATRAREFFQQAISLDPAFVLAYAALAETYIWDFNFGSRTLEEASRLGRREAEAALAIDSRSAEAHGAMGTTLFWIGDPTSALAHYELALSINPNDTSARLGKVYVLLYGGQPAAARTVLLETWRLNPLDRTNPYAVVSLITSYYLEGDYAEAADAARRGIAMNPSQPQAYRWLAAALGQLGQFSGANEALRKALDISPQSFRNFVNARPPWYRPEDHELMLEGLRKAGWEG